LFNITLFYDMRTLSRLELCPFCGALLSSPW